MNESTLRKVVALARKTGSVLVATADSGGLPHLAAAGRLGEAGDGRLSVAAWFCPGTVQNVQENRRISLVVWDHGVDSGYQILGEVEKVRELAMLDGYIPGQEGKPQPPQVERELLVRVDRILAFSRAPHSDVEE
jgi:hypothetical protein